MNVGAILDNVAGELDAQVLAYMQEYAIPPSLMDKVPKISPTTNTSKR